MKRRHFCKTTIDAAVAVSFHRELALAALAEGSAVSADIKAVTGTGKEVLLKQSAVEELAASLRGNVALPGSEAYESARLLLNPRVNRYPALVVQPLVPNGRLQRREIRAPGEPGDRRQVRGPQFQGGLRLRWRHADRPIRKGFSFHDFVCASQLIRERGGQVKAYLLLKPPLLTEGQAIKDTIFSAQRARPYADILSLNLCNEQRGTLLERLWERGGYRPPWLWSAVEVLKNAKGPIFCDPVGAGAKRGPHNCGQCDAVVAEAIRKHALMQDTAIFEGLNCLCMAAWRRILEL